MTPFNENRKSYITVCSATAVIYAFVAGVNQPVFFRLLDGIIYGIILFSSGFALWNIFRFAIPAHVTQPYRIIFLSVFALVTSALMIGIETFALFLCFPTSFAAFVPTLPVRLFITLLLFIMAYLFYLNFNENIEENHENSATDPAKTLMNSSQTSENSMPTPALPLIDHITVRNGQKIKIIPVNSIIYIEADGDYISIHTAEGKWLKEQTMKYTEDRLPINSFIRIHRSYIVNIHQISRIERYGEKQLIVLHNNEKIKISAARYQLLKQLLGI